MPQQPVVLVQASMKPHKPYISPIDFTSLLHSATMSGYGPDVGGINGSLDFRVAHGKQGPQRSAFLKGAWAPSLGPKLVPKMLPKLSQNGPKMVSKWSQNGPKMIRTPQKPPRGSLRLTRLGLPSMRSPEGFP